MRLFLIHTSRDSDFVIQVARFLKASRLPDTPSLSSCGGRGEGEGAIVKGLNAFVLIMGKE